MFSSAMECLNLLSFLVLSVVQMASINTHLFGGYVAGEMTVGADSSVPCPAVERVCSALMKVGPTSTFEEGLYCSCDGCSQKWEENDRKSFTWYHHERGDWQVQYKFCEPIMPKAICRSEQEIAAVITADSKGWHPKIKNIQCQCPGGEFFLKGWNLVADTHWDYHYACSKPQCEVAKTCVKQYLDSTHKKTVGYKFLCTCPEGMQCPTGKPLEDNVEVEGTDNAGPFITNTCLRLATPKPNMTTR